MVVTRKTFATLVLAPAILAGGQAQTPSPSPGPVFPADVEAVTVDVVVLDQRGLPVEGLTRDDFRLTEDDRPQVLTSFEAAALGESEPVVRPSRTRLSTNVERPARPERSFVIVFDNAHLAPTQASRAKAALEDFLRTGLQPGDQVTVVPTAGGAWWTAGMPEGYEDLRKFLARLDGQRVQDISTGRISDYEALRLHVHRDPAVTGMVARRYYENGLIVELPQGRGERETRRDLDVSPGLALIQAKAAQVYTAARSRARHTLRTLERVIESLAAGKGRKAVLLVSEGFIHDPSVGEFRDVVRAARQANAAVYFIDAAGGPGVLGAGVTDSGVPVEERDVLTVAAQAPLEVGGAVSVAADTGGESFRNAQDLAEGMRRVVAESRAYYLLGYQSTNAKRDGKFRKIRVEVDRQGVEVRARRGYYAQGGRQPKPDPKELDPGLRRALDAPSAVGALPLRLVAHVLGARDGKASVLLVAEADPRPFVFKEKAGRYEGSLESYVVVASRDTGENFHQQKRIDLSLPGEVRAALERSWLPILREFELPTGTYQARVLLRDEKGGRVGTVRHDFEVPDLRQLRVSTPVLTDTTQVDASGQPRPVPVARRVFAPGARLVYVFEVYGADRDSRTRAPRVSVEYVIRRGDGTTFAEVPPRPLTPGLQGEIAHRVVLGLDHAQPGDYEITLRVRDEVAGKTLEVRDPFTVGS